MVDFLGSLLHSEPWQLAMLVIHTCNLGRRKERMERGKTKESLGPVSLPSVCAITDDSTENP